MKDNIINKKPKNKNLVYSLLAKLIFFLITLKLCNSSCGPDYPFLKNGVCEKNCTLEELNNGCIIENKNLRTQWINSIIYLTEEDYPYINLVTSKDNDLIVIMSSYPSTNKRLFYGLNTEGRGYFTIDNKESTNYTMTINNPSITRYESEIFMVKLSQSYETKEYIMDFGKQQQLLHFYDLENKQVVLKDFSQVFYSFNNVRQLIGAKLKLTSTSDNYYIIGVLYAIFINSNTYNCYFSLIKFSISSLNGDVSLVSKSKNEISSAVYTESLSCYETSTYYIICFYKNPDNEYIVGAFCHSSLNLEKTAKLQDGNDDIKMFFKCAHFYQDIGAFIYYSNTNLPYAILEFQRYSDNTIYRYYNTIITFSNYSLYYHLILNDIIKVEDKKIIFAAASLNQKELYITSIYNYDQDKIVYKIYKINSFAYIGYNFLNIIRLEIYNNFLVLGSNTNTTGPVSTLIIFSYPNSKDINNELTEFLLKNNDIKINNIKLEIKNLCNIDNNIFGHILIGFKIIEIYKITNEYLSLEDGTEIQEEILDIDTTLKLVIQKNGNIYSNFTYGIKYVCQSKEPEYEEYNSYPIFIEDTGITDKEQNYFESERKSYFGRYSYYNFSLINELTEVGCDEKCQLCYNTNKNKCITCKRNDFDLEEDYKICNEDTSTTIISTIPEIKEIISIPESTISKLITEEITCSFDNIIKGNCKGEVNDEMAQDIYLYIKNHLLNSTIKEDNLLVKTPSTTFQLTTVDYQKNNNLNISMIDLGECENRLRTEYNISKEKDLIIFKIDIKESNKSLTYVQYEIYHPETFQQLKLDYCENLLINITVPSNLDSETILLYQSLNNNGYNLFNSNDEFYTDICTPYTSTNNTDILLIDRKNDIYNKYANITICQENCNLESYNEISNTVSCFCNPQSNETKIDLNIDKKFSLKTMRDTFYNYLNNSNFRVLKCYKVAFDLTTIIQNIGRIIMTIILIIFIILFVLFLIKGNNKISLYLKEILNNKMKENQKNKKGKKKGKLSGKRKTFKKNKNIINNNNDKIENNLLKNDIETIKVNPGKKIKIQINEKNNGENLIKETNNVKKEINYNKYKRRKRKINKTSPIIWKSNNQNSSTKTFIGKNSKKNNIFVYNIINNFNSEKIIKNTINNKIVQTALNDQELNTLDYDNALILDKRTYLQYYCSLLKKKHLIIFTFIPNNDYNLQYIKIILFLLSFSLYFSINGFFFTDETMHQIYKDSGMVNYVKQLAAIIYSSIIPAIINIILKILSLSENSILKLKNQKDINQALEMSKKIQKSMKIKFIIFFILCYVLLFFFWYFITCFCGIYKNTQKVLIIDTLISFCMSMIYPVVINLLPGIFRISALRAINKDKKCIYQISGYIALI